MQNINYIDYLKDDGVIVQIGSYDGIAGENFWLRELMLAGNYTCHLLEPLDDVFTELKKNYADATSNMNFHNCAIYTADGFMTFYKFKDYSSFVDKDGVLANPGSATVLVKSQRLPTFFEENKITEVDGLFLDVEGVENVIIRQLFQETSVRPAIIRYEWIHVKGLEEMEDIIRSNGYTITPCVHTPWLDKVCVRNDLIK